MTNSITHKNKKYGVQSVEETLGYAVPNTEDPVMKLKVKKILKQKLRKRGGSFGESKIGGVIGWWDGLTAKKKLKVVAILGLSKRDAKAFLKLARSTQLEVEAYYAKHKGKIEGVDSFDAFKELVEKRKG